MPERMTPERLQQIEAYVTEEYQVYDLRLALELIAEIRACWDDIDGLTGEIESIKHQDNDER